VNRFSENRFFWADFFPNRFFHVDLNRFTFKNRPSLMVTNRKAATVLHVQRNGGNPTGRRKIPHNVGKIKADSCMSTATTHKIQKIDWLQRLVTWQWTERSRSTQAAGPRVTPLHTTQSRLVRDTYFGSVAIGENTEIIAPRSNTIDIMPHI
jgi:hypothetical protein